MKEKTMSNEDPISLVTIVENETGLFIVEAGVDKRLPEIEELTVPAALGRLNDIFKAAHAGQQEEGGVDISWVRENSAMTVQYKGEPFATLSAVKPKTFDHAA